MRMKENCWLLAQALLVGLLWAGHPHLRAGASAAGAASADIEFLRGLTRDVVAASRVKPGERVGGVPANSCGVTLIMPGGRGSYPAFWIRDFAMSLESGFITAEEMLNHLRLTARCQNGPTARQLEHGLVIPPFTIPDHVNFDGSAVFYPGTYASGEDQGTGTYGILPPVDDHYEFAHMAWCLFRATGKPDFLDQAINGMRLMDRIEAAFAAPRTDPETGLVTTDLAQRAVGFGFCDAVVFTGKMLFPSLLRYRAAGQLAELCEALGRADRAGEYRGIQARIAASLAPAFSDAPRIGGWLMGATEVGRQADVWGTLYALHLGVLPEAAAERALATVVDAVRRRTIVFEGAVRHVPTDLDASPTSAWERTAVRFNTYQNGAYWHTPSGWLIAALRRRDPQLAAQVLADYVDHARRSDFRRGSDQGAPWECIHPGGYAQNGVYMTSAALPWGVLFSGGLEPANRTGRSSASCRQAVEEEFAAHAAGIGSAAAVNRLVATIEFEPREARVVRLVIVRPHAGEPCLDEIEVHGPDSATNLALAGRGAVARASSLLPGYAIHAVAHLNDGLYGNDHSWIAATAGEEWAEIELPEPARIARVVLSRDRDGRFTDRQILEAEARLSLDGRTWETVGMLRRSANDLRPPMPTLTLPLRELPEPTWAGAVDYAFLRERDTWSRMDATDYLSPLVNDRPASPGGPPYWGRLARLDPLERTLVQYSGMIERLGLLGLDVGAERAELAALRREAEDPAVAGSDDLFLRARHAKRRLFFRDPRLGALERVLFAKHHPLQPSHNYSEHLDSLFAPGGGICVLHVPRDAAGRLDPARAEVETLFDGSGGIVRHPVADYEARTVYFAYRPDRPEVEGWQSYWHLYSVRADGSGLRRLTEGPFHDFDPVPLPDGALGFMSTRCQGRYLCWEPQAYVLYRMRPDGTDLRRLSYANISEWDPVVMRDGRILWTRSEYLDKGADFGHTLWAIRPDGTHPELVFGNNTPYCYGHAREVPGSQELVCTLISHGDHQGPIALIDPARGVFDTAALTSITPDTRPQYQMDRSHHETFRDPEAISRDHFLVAHNPGRQSHWGLYVIDRFGNRELLYLDPAISSKRPSLLRVQPRPPLLFETHNPDLAREGLGQFVVQDVYEGLGPAVARGQAKYLQVSQEVPSPLERLADGQYRNAHPGYPDYYATPIHLVTGPRQDYSTRTANALEPHAFRAGGAARAGDGTAMITEHGGWPSYVAKAVLGTVRVAEDGSANFTAPAGKVLYFHLLDEHFNELQRMRSVVQLQPGEQRSCIGCHEDRHAAPLRPPRRPLAAARQTLTPPPWGAVAFDYERMVQPVLDAHCVRCHDTQSEAPLDLRGTRDAERVPESYRSLIRGGWVHYFDWHYGARHFKAEPLTFGTRRSRLFTALDGEQHKTVALEPADVRALKAWIDLNCPLWPDYRHRSARPL